MPLSSFTTRVGSVCPFLPYLDHAQAEEEDKYIPCVPLPVPSSPSSPSSIAENLLESGGRANNGLFNKSCGEAYADVNRARALIFKEMNSYLAHIVTDGVRAVEGDSYLCVDSNTNEGNTNDGENNNNKTSAASNASSLVRPLHPLVIAMQRGAYLSSSSSSSSSFSHFSVDAKPSTSADTNENNSNSNTNNSKRCVAERPNRTDVSVLYTEEERRAIRQEYIRSERTRLAAISEAVSAGVVGERVAVLESAARAAKRQRVEIMRRTEDVNAMRVLTQRGLWVAEAEAEAEARAGRRKLTTPTTHTPIGGAKTAKSKSDDAAKAVLEKLLALGVAGVQS